MYFEASPRTSGISKKTIGGLQWDWFKGFLPGRGTSEKLACWHVKWFENLNLDWLLINSEVFSSKDQCLQDSDVTVGFLFLFPVSATEPLVNCVLRSFLPSLISAPSLVPSVAVLPLDTHVFLLQMLVSGKPMTVLCMWQKLTNHLVCICLLFKFLTASL